MAEPGRHSDVRSWFESRLDNHYFLNLESFGPEKSMRRGIRLERIYDFIELEKSKVSTGTSPVCRTSGSSCFGPLRAVRTRSQLKSVLRWPVLKLQERRWEQPEGSSSSPLQALTSASGRLLVSR